MGLDVFWYIVVIVAITCYVMLDGFDLGVGSLHLFAKNDLDRRTFLNAIGPVWDGNEVWIVVVVGGLLAGFPYAYATLFSAMYTPISLLIFGLIFRAVAIEFRSKLPHRWWRITWDVLFSLASIVIVLMIGLAIGNFIQGIPLDKNKDYIGGAFVTFIQPYPVLIGLFALTLLMLHGTLYLLMKTEGQLQAKIKRWVYPTMASYVFMYLVATVATFIYEPHMIEKMGHRPWLYVVGSINVIALILIPLLLRANKVGSAFLASCLNIAMLMALYGIGTFPNIIRSSINPGVNSLNIENSAASPATLVVLAVIVAIGIPLVIAYGFYVYRLFHGKVKIDEEHSY